jgi:hypothetical protein
VLDVQRLAAASCDCYRISKAALDGLGL